MSQTLDHFEFDRTAITEEAGFQPRRPIKPGETARIEQTDVNLGRTITVVDALPPRDRVVEIAGGEKQ